MATFGSINIFGPSPTITPRDLQRAAQTNGFAGVNGVEELDLGERTSGIMVTGILTGMSPVALGLAEALFRSFKDGNTHAFADNIGNVWLEVKLLEFSPQPRIMRDRFTGKRVRKYSATFVIIG